ncbi:MAG: nuclear transport factor 2 family protein [Methylococcales bacterium]
MKKLFLMALIVGSTIYCSNIQLNKTHMTNKEKVTAIIKSVETGDTIPASLYINPKKYIQHNAGAPDGIQGFYGFIKYKPANGYKTNVVRVFEEGDYVFTHSQGDLYGAKIFFDIFRFENGLIVEHWDNMQTTETQNQSGHSMIDGTIKASDLKKSAENKQIIQSLYTDVFLGGNLSNIDTYISSEKYIQHNPGSPDGKDAFAYMMKMAKEQNWFKVIKTHLILAEGDFVLVQSEGIMKGKEATFYDLFRVEAGKVVEHWDVIEPATPKEQWKNTNGKF